MKTKIRCFAACVVAALLSFVPLAQADVTSYFMQGGTNGGFGVVDLSTGAYTLRGNSGGPADSAVIRAEFMQAPTYSALSQTFGRVNLIQCGSMTLIGVSTEPYMDIGSTTNGLVQWQSVPSWLGLRAFSSGAIEASASSNKTNFRACALGCTVHSRCHGRVRV
jgi:hypothetical protein